MNDDVPVVVLCGGQGTRLREITERVPKPLVDVGGRPLLWHLLKLYGHHGFEQFVLCLGYKGWQIKDFFLHYNEHLRDVTVDLRDGGVTVHDGPGGENWQVTCAETGELTGTGGRLAAVRSYVDGGTFMLTYGDGLGSVDIGELLAFHRRCGRIATVTGVSPRSRYGEMRPEGHVVQEFNEKPTHTGSFVSGGFFVFEPEVFDYLDDDPAHMLESAPLQKLAREGELALFPHEGFWMGMDTYRDWTELNERWNSGEVPWRVWP
jgi:glucose-1-phosphate cytidylyltransferase